MTKLITTAIIGISEAATKVDTFKVLVTEHAKCAKTYASAGAAIILKTFF